jgi:hypothetical protein
MAGLGSRSRRVVTNYNQLFQLLLWAIIYDANDLHDRIVKATSDSVTVLYDELAK